MEQSTYDGHVRNIPSMCASAMSLATIKMLEDTCETLRKCARGLQNRRGCACKAEGTNYTAFVRLQLSRDLLIAYHVIIVCALFSR